MIGIAVGPKTLATLANECRKQNYFFSGLFRVFVKDLAEKYNKPTEGFDPPITHLAQERKGRGGNVFASKFSTEIPREILQEIWQERAKEKTYFYGFSRFLREELLEWLNGKGYNLEFPDMLPVERKLEEEAA